MAVNIAVQASIIDLRCDVPKPNDVFLIDTNVWYWMTYSPLSITPRSYQIREYPNYVSKARRAGTSLLKLDLSFAELAHSIERDEYAIFNQSTPCYFKEFRHNYPAQRAQVVNEVHSSWLQMESIALSLALNIDKPMMRSVLSSFINHELDGYDLFFIEALKNTQITGIITDDLDFSCYPGIQVFTANKAVIDLARAQGRLIKR